MARSASLWLLQRLNAADIKARSVEGADSTLRCRGNKARAGVKQAFPAIGTAQVGRKILGTQHKGVQSRRASGNIGNQPQPLGRFDKRDKTDPGFLPFENPGQLFDLCGRLHLRGSSAKLG